MWTEYVGHWTGTNRLFFEGADGPALTSPSTFGAEIVVGGFLQVRYHWVFKDRPKEGLLLLGEDAEEGLVAASWVDSFHSSKRVMFFEGTGGENGVSVKGSYEAAEGPPWGWRIALALAGAELRLTMYNIEPGATEELAVAAEYQRVL